MERFVGCSARSVVTILTELPQPPRNATGRTCFSPGTCLLSLSQKRHAVARTSRNDTEMKKVEFADANSNIM